MRLNVRLFAGLVQAAGSRVIAVELPETADAQALLDHVGRLVGRDMRAVRVAVDYEYVPNDHPLRGAGEVALIPPVSGGCGDALRVAIQAEPIAVDDLVRAVSHPGAGAICVFLGIVRAYTDGVETVELEYEAYAEMARRELAALADQAEARWPEVRLAVTHRTGTLAVGEASVVIAASSPRRAPCFEAARWAIERLKETVPIWKREVWADGTAWVGAQTAEYPEAKARPQGS
ncbi:MAG TPA: molybdenum cofactor biosynthesis protein MoaE [Limnochordia bacterium]|nr:molybdenum cofactor biosynthesis protein MoaE [Limnochordia bacterium]